MPFTHLNNLSQILEKHYQDLSDDGSLNDRLLIAYGRRVLSELVYLFKIHEEERVNPADALVDFLKINWMLVNRTCLSPTALSNTDIMDLLCDIAETTAAEKNKSKAEQAPQMKAIKLLMPSLIIDASYNIFPIKTILKTHVLGENSRYLLPVVILTNLDLLEDASLMLNPYDPEAYITPEEYQRLARHSPLTQSLYDIKNEHDCLMDDKSTLRDQLTQLCQQLKFNTLCCIGSSVENPHSLSVMKFLNYWDKLDSVEKEKLPDSIKQAITRLLEASSNIGRPIDAYSRELMSYVSEHEVQLDSISIPQEKKKAISHEMQVRYNRIRVELTNKDPLEGTDKLGFHPQLFQKMNCSFILDSKTDLEIFQVLKATEIALLLKDKEVQSEIIDQFIDNRSSLVHFIIGLSLEKLRALISGINRDEWLTLIPTSYDLGILLMTLDNEKFQMIFNAMSGFHFNLINTTYQLSCLLRYFSSKQRIHVDSTLPIWTYINSTEDLASVLSYFSAPQCINICKMIRSNYKSFPFITSPEKLTIVLKVIHPAEACKAIFKVINGSLGGPILSVVEFQLISNCLSLEQAKAIFEVMTEKLPAFIQFIEDFFSLPVDKRHGESSIATILLIQNKLSTSFNSLVTVLEGLTKNTRSIILDLMRNKSSSLQLFKNCIGDTSQPVCELEAALKEGHREEIKASFDSLILALLKAPLVQQPTFFSKIDRMTHLLDALSILDIWWLNLLNQALNLGLNDVREFLIKDIRCALESYISQLVRTHQDVSFNCCD